MSLGRAGLGPQHTRVGAAGTYPQLLPHSFRLWVAPGLDSSKLAWNLQEYIEPLLRFDVMFFSKSLESYSLSLAPDRFGPVTAASKQANALQVSHACGVSESP